MSTIVDNVAMLDGVWTWFNYPRAYYDQATQKLYYAAVTQGGRPTLHGWDYGRRLLTYGCPHQVAIEIDDHDDPAMLVLQNGSNAGKIFTAYSMHNGTQYCALSCYQGSITAWGTEVTVSSGNSDSYVVLWEDPYGTIYWWYRRNINPGNRRLRTSTDGGATWTEVGDFISNGTQRPYQHICRNGNSRVDFFVSTGQPDEVTCSLYHFYMTVDSTGVRSYFKSDGTSIGTDSALPLALSNMTLVWDGTVANGNSWNWDIKIVGGTITVVFATFESTDTVHRYYMGRWSGSVWQTQEIGNAQGGTSGTADYLYAAQSKYSGGIALDPNDINSVYLSSEYGAGDFRVEKWTGTGSWPTLTWAKAADISGSTGTVNARPWCPDGRSPTQVFWWSGTYTSYTSYATQLLTQPNFSWRVDRKPSGRWFNQYAPYGVQAYYLISEGNGAPQDLTGNNYNMTQVGSPTWNTGTSADFGAYLSGFSTANYFTVDALATAINMGSYPVWIVVLIKGHSSTAAQETPFMFGRAANNTTTFCSFLNLSASANATNSFARDDANSALQATYTKTASSDGAYHVLGIVIESNARCQLVFDGINQVKTSGTTLGVFTLDQCTMGVRRGSTLQNVYTGQIHAVLAGWGNTPNFDGLALDLLRGQFAGTFDPGAPTFNADFLLNTDVIGSRVEMVGY